MRIHLSLVTIAGLLLVPAIGNAQQAPAPAATPIEAAQKDAASPDARQMSPEARARWEKFRAACGADLQTHCATVARGSEQGRGEMRQCVDTHKAKFSTACQAAIVERDAAREARKQALPTAEKPKS